MQYKELICGIKNFEDFFWFGEYVYFKALERLENMRADLSRLETNEHVKQIIKMFLIQWGRMGRTVDREDLNWEQLTKTTTQLQRDFSKATRQNFTRYKPRRGRNSNSHQRSL